MGNYTCIPPCNLLLRVCVRVCLGHEMFFLFALIRAESLSSLTEVSHSMCVCVRESVRERKILWNKSTPDKCDSST